MMVGRANRGAGALRVDEAFLAVSILQVADGVRRPAIRVRGAFAALRPVGITNGFVGRTLGIGCTFDAHSRGYITGGSVARTVRVGGARDIAPMIFGMAYLPRITVITGTTLFALADDAKRRHRTTVHVGEAFDAAEAFVTPKDALFFHRVRTLPFLRTNWCCSSLRKTCCRLRRTRRQVPKHFPP